MSFFFSFCKRAALGEYHCKKNYFGCRIFKKKMVVFFSRILTPLCQAARVQLPSLLSVHSFLHPQSSFQHTHIRLSSCPSPLKKCSPGLRYRGNRITFGRETPRFISTIMRQNGLGGKSNILPTTVIAGLWVNKRLSIRLLKYLLTSIIIIRAPTEFDSGIIKKDEEAFTVKGRPRKFQDTGK